MHSSNRDSGLGVRGSTALVLVLFVAFALVTNAQRGAGTPMWFEGARLIVGDGNTIDNAAFLVEGEAFTWVGKQGQRQPPQGAMRVIPWQHMTGTSSARRLSTIAISCSYTCVFSSSW